MFEQQSKRILTKSQAVSILVAISDKVQATSLEDIMFYNKKTDHKYFSLSTEELKNRIFSKTNLDENDIYDVVEDPVEIKKPKM